MSEIIKNELRVKDFFLAHIDILGYKEILGKNKDGEDIFLTKLLNIDKDLCTITEDLKNIHKNDDIFIDRRMFSDNFILYAPCSNDNFTNTKILSSLLNTAAAFQNYLMQCHSFYSRGAIAKGSFYANNNLVFGSSLIEAYELETYLAVYPRIICSNSIIDFVSEIRNADDYFKNMVFMDNDGFYTINPFWVHTKFDQSPDYEFLGKKILLNILECQASHNIKVMTKYIWLANLYNYTCLHFEIFKDYCIDHALLKLK